MVDLTCLRFRGIGPVGKRPFANPTEDLVELRFADEEGVVLWRDLAIGIHEIDVGAVVGRDHLETAPTASEGVDPTDTWLSWAHTMV